MQYGCILTCYCSGIPTYGNLNTICNDVNDHKLLNSWISYMYDLLKSPFFFGFSYPLAVLHY